MGAFCFFAYERGLSELQSGIRIRLLDLLKVGAVEIEERSCVRFTRRFVEWKEEQRRLIPCKAL